jgi:hypothetical protein
MGRLELVLWAIAIGLGLVAAFVVLKHWRIVREGFQAVGGTGIGEVTTAGIRPVEGEPGVFIDMSGNKFQGPSDPRIVMTPDGPVLNPMPPIPYEGPEGAVVAKKACCPLSGIYNRNKEALAFIDNRETLERELESAPEEIRVQVRASIDGNPLIPAADDPEYAAKVQDLRDKMAKALDDFKNASCSDWGYDINNTNYDCGSETA